ncbi:maltokinase N-terminal cap-like domain-containing protein [Streptomyces sp. NPDC003327]
MAVIHRTTLRPTKLELLAAWLPTREWYAGGEPRPVKAGGFRLDDPEGEVGIEFMVVTDGEAPDAVAYLVPMTYRAGPLDGAEDGLIGTTEHGVLGKRWVYDGAHDPVFVAQSYALLTGRAVPQAQSLTDTPDPTVAASVDGLDGLADSKGFEGSGGDAEIVRVTDGPGRTDIEVRTPGAAAPLVLRLRRTPGDVTEPEAVGRVVAEWRRADGTTAREPFVLVLPVTPS